MNISLIKKFIDESSDVLCQQWIKSVKIRHTNIKIMNIYNSNPILKFSFEHFENKKI